MEVIVERLTPDQIEQFLSIISTSYKEVDDGAYIFMVENRIILLFNNGDSLKLYTSFPGKHSISKANEWNKTKKYTKAYVESDGMIALQADYSLKGGVTRFNIGAWFGMYTSSLEAFCLEVL